MPIHFRRKFLLVRFTNNDKNIFEFFIRSGDLSRFGPVCREPMVSRSPLARKVLHLLENEIDSDLEFVLPAEPDAEQAVDHVVKAHRVILAARCRWFYRALLSGMREAIDRWDSHHSSLNNGLSLKLKL